MKVLVTGAAGQLGHDVVNALLTRGHEVTGTDRAGNGGHIPLDITDEKRVMQVMEMVRPDAVVHCAAWTAVDLAEEPGNKEKVYAVNADGTGYIADACRKPGCKLVYISTDYVFDGSGGMPWKPDCSGYQPLNVYGRSKLAGELAVAERLEKYFIVRIAWAFGANGGNFVRTMLDLGKKHDSIRVVCDQIGTPTYTYDLAGLLTDMIETEKYGYYHATNEGGYISWYDFAREIFRQAGYGTEVIPVTTAEYERSAAKRPLNSRLDTTKLTETGFTQLPHWQDALGRYLKQTAADSDGGGNGFGRPEAL